MAPNAQTAVLKVDAATVWIFVQNGEVKKFDMATDILSNGAAPNIDSRKNRPPHAKRAKNKSSPDLL